MVSTGCSKTIESRRRLSLNDDALSTCCLSIRGPLLAPIDSLESLYERKLAALDELK